MVTLPWVMLSWINPWSADYLSAQTLFFGVFTVTTTGAYNRPIRAQ
jgi:hypothetical protein